jgi:hypothetical protein
MRQFPQVACCAGGDTPKAAQLLIQPGFSTDLHLWRANMTQIRIRLGILCLTLLVLGLCSGAVALRAQTTTEGAIAGTVLDPSGATVANAAVTIHNVQPMPKSS